MKRLPLSLLAHWAGGELIGDDLVIGSLTNDTRTLVPGSLYVALRGERFDGHRFLKTALLQGGAAAALAQLSTAPSPSLGIMVPR